jgi:thiosulfate/3-mercaptopyruvate sulfurtransferase
MSQPRYTTLITPTQLQSLMDAGAPLMVFDCSAELTDPTAGDTQFAASHIAGAVHASAERDLSTHDAARAVNGGRHPLPRREHVAEWLSRIGFRNDMQAVVYDRQGSIFAGRLWWMLKWLGHDDVAVLDGGLAAWQASGGALESGEAAARRAPGTFELKPALRELRTQAEVAARLGQPDAQTLIDARARPRFLGEVEPLDPVAGHIPGALNRPSSDNFDAEGRFKDAATLRADFERLLAGRAPATVVQQCGSGISAIANMLAMELAGYAPQPLYAGSWSEWCNTPGAPVAKGDEAA